MSSYKMKKINKALEFLKSFGRLDLVYLLKLSTYQFVECERYEDFTFLAVEIISPKVFTEALKSLNNYDQQRICESIIATDDSSKEKPELVIFNSQSNIDVESNECLVPEIVIQRNEMISVGTGGKRIQDINDYYRARRRRIIARLKSMGLDEPNPHEDLWDWYKKWKKDFASYAQRRQYINTLYQPLIDRLVAAHPPAVPIREPTGWERVDRALEKARLQFAEGRNEEDYQAVGLLCREIIISLGQAVFDPALHKSSDGVTPSETDCGRMIEAFLTSTAVGNSNENIRRYARASLNLTVELQHKRTADFRAAALCLEATSSLVNILAIISGRRDPK